MNALKKRYKSIADRMRRSSTGRESDERSLSVILFIFRSGCDVINHKNATVRVNVTGSIRVKPGFEPGSRCPCERGVKVHKSEVQNVTVTMAKALRIPATLLTIIVSGKVRTGSTNRL